MAKQLNRAWMTTATVGTGTVTLGSARSADYFTFAEAGAENLQIYNYVLLDGSDVEIGTGTYTASGTTFSRDTVVKSRIAGVSGTTKLTLSGNATIFITALASDFREVLTGNRTYYVRTDGSDSNTGLANSAAGAFLTLQKAANAVMGLDRGFYTTSIQVGNGTYTGGIAFYNGAGIGNGGNVVLLGDSATPSNVVISTTSADAIFMGCTFALYVEGFKLQTTTAGSCIVAVGGDTVIKNVDFGSSAGSHIVAVGRGYVSNGANNYTVSGGATVAHIYAARGGIVEFYNGTFTFTGTPNLAHYVITEAGGVFSLFNPTYSGSANGKRYYVNQGSSFVNYSVAYSALPGNAPGHFEGKDLFVKLEANYTLTSVTTPQKLFNTSTNGALSLDTGTYEFECMIYLTTMSGTSGNGQFQIRGAGTATLARNFYQVVGVDSTTPLNAGAAARSGSVTESGVASMVTAATGTGMIAHVQGTFNVTAAGTIIPSIALVTANAAIVQANSYFRCKRLTENGTNTFGEWT